MSRGRLVPSWLFLKLTGVGAAALLILPVIPQVGAIVLILDVLLVVLLILDGGTVPLRRNLGVERSLGLKLSLGEENPGVLRLRNFTGRRVRGTLRQNLPEGFAIEDGMKPVSIAPYGEQDIEFKVFAPRRGIYDIGPVYLRLRGRLGLAERDLTFDAGRTVKVYPNLMGVGRYELMARTSHLSQIGFRQVRRIGAGTEFEKLREYLPDDDYRHINWKATAKKRRPITQEFQIERSQNIFICLDTSRYMAYRAGELTKLDYAINATLMLAHVARRFDDNVGLMVFSNRVRAYNPPRKTGGHWSTLVETLYALTPERCAVEYGEAVHTLSARQKKRSLVVIFTDFFDRRDAQALLDFLPLLRRRHLVLCITVLDARISELASSVPAGVDDAFDRYVAGEVLKERARIHIIMRNQGALVADSQPQNLTVAAVNQYLQVKARQMI